MFKYFHEEHGVTLIEVSIATVVMAISLMAIVGLFVSAVKAATLAKAHTVATEYANQKIEEIRGMNYDYIGLTSGGSGDTPYGTLPPSEVTTLTGGVNVTVTYNIQWIDDPKDGQGTDDSDPYDYKRLTITIAWSNDGSNPSITVTTNIRKKEHETDAPGVSWDEGSPESMEVISGTNTLIATATDTDGTIDTISFYCSGRRIINFPFGETPATANHSWDTTELITAEESTENAGQPKYPDGVREIRVEAYDNLGKNAILSRYIVIDNYPPEFEDENPLSAGVTSNNYVVLNWSMAYDGTDLCRRYNIYYKKVLSLEDPVLYTGDTIETNVGSYMVSGLDADTDYYFIIRAKGINPNNSDGELSNYIIARTEISGGELADIDLFKIEKLITGSKARYTLYFNAPLHANDFKIYQSEFVSGPFTNITSDCNTSIGSPSVTVHDNQNKIKVFYYYIEGYTGPILVAKSPVRQAPYP